MSGYLYNLRSSWRIHTAPGRILESPPTVFLHRYGKTCEFKHAGMDCEGRGDNRHYNGLVYAVFTTKKDTLNLIPLTKLDLQLIEETMRGMSYSPDRDAIVKNMTEQLRAANVALKAHIPLGGAMSDSSLVRRQIA